MGSRVGASVLVSRANRIKTKLQSALDATVLEVEDVSYQHAGHVAVKDNPNNETHFNLKIISPKFDGQTLIKRHRMVYDLLADELESGLHALSIQAKTPKEAGSAGHSWIVSTQKSKPFFLQPILIVVLCLNNYVDLLRQL